MKTRSSRSRESPSSNEEDNKNTERRKWDNFPQNKHSQKIEKEVTF